MGRNRNFPFISNTYDIIVIGLGANGSSALWHLSKTGKKVLGIDRFQPPHQKGSSHGESRIIRQAYHEGPFYVPLVKAAYPIWAELERAAGKPLFQKTGGLLLGAPDTAVVKGARLSAETHDIPFEWLDAAINQDPGIVWLRNDPLLKGLTGDPRYEALLRKVNLPEQTAANSSAVRG